MKKRELPWKGRLGGMWLQQMPMYGLKVKKRELPWKGRLGAIWLKTYVSLGFKGEKKRELPWDIIADLCPLPFCLTVKKKKMIKKKTCLM
jgi:hypothetical protein